MVTFPLRSPHPGWPGLENVRDTHDAAGLVCAGPCSAYRGAALWLPGKPRARRCGGAGLPLGSDSLAGFTNGWAYRTVSSCFRWPIRAYHVHLRAMDTVGTACYRCPMKTLITIAAVALVGYYAFSFLLAMPMFMLVIGACIWLLVALTGVSEN